MSLTSLRNTLEWALMVALVLGGGAYAQAQNDQPGKIVRIAPADGTTTADAEVMTSEDADQMAQPEMPKHWIGILGGPITPELRAQLDIPEGQGLLVRQVVPDSPAAKAGLQNFDVMLRANDADLHEMTDLMELVRSTGENGGTIALDVLRRGKHEAITITPETRPEQVTVSQPDMMQGDATFAGPPQDAMRMFQQRFGRGGPFQFRAFGPGTVLQGRTMSLDQMPNGVSVSIQKQNDEPAHITVRRGNDSWNIVGDDPASLDQLPKDVRPFVEQLLAGGGPMQIPLPAMPNVTVPNPPMPPMPHAFNDDALQQRLHNMEQQLQQMQTLLQQNVESMHGDRQNDSQSE
jgi:serine protease Do